MTTPENKSRICWRWKTEKFRTWAEAEVSHTGNPEIITLENDYGSRFIVSVEDIEWKPAS